ncbi:MAG: hypothetical protein CMJ48_14010 [Planctomycetaceae bacterium]|nr:hypothetical protein [Planctomycetaceae bacterium]
MGILHFIGRSRVASLALAAALLCVVSTAWADVRPAVRKVLPATVAVKWQAKPADGKSGAAAKKSGLPPHVKIGLVDGKRVIKSDWPTSYVTYATGVGSTDVSLASGTVVSADGLIVSTMLENRKEGSISVTFSNGKTLPARVVVTDERSKLQLLKVDAKDLGFVKVAKADVELGQDVIATPCTDLKDRIVTRGIITAKNQRVSGPVSDALQTDLSIGQMGSGAPLVDAQGALVGILVAGSDRDSRALSNKSRQGIAFARPAFWVSALLDAYKVDAAVTIRRGVIGVSFVPANSTITKSVHAGLPAEKAGIKPGDNIVRIDEHPVASAQDVIRLIGRGLIGDEITVTVLREGEKQTKKLKIGTIEVRKQAAATPAKKADITLRGVYKFETVTPGRVIFFNKDGKKIELKIDKPLPQTPEELKSKARIEIQKNAIEIQRQVEAARKQFEALKKGVTDAPRASVIRVQRSDVEKKIDALSNQVEALTDRIDKLTGQLEKLARQLEKE